MTAKLGKFAKSLRQGQTIYKVYGLGDRSFCVTYVVDSKPFLFKKPYGDYWVISLKMVSRGMIHDASTAHLLDMNAISGLNGYNEHRVFTSKSSANKYLTLCKELGIGVKKTSFSMPDQFCSKFQNS